ncbi:MAG: hypothetical protein ACYCZX_13905, partial [Rhodospirillaceae bacterium]
MNTPENNRRMVRFVSFIANASSRSLAWQLGISVAVVLAALGIRLTVGGALGPVFIYATFYPAIILATLFGRCWGGVLAIVLSAVLANTILAPLRTATGWHGLVAFLVSGA